jgi:hypothetical protein
LLIGGDREKHVGGFARDLELEEIVVLEDLGVVERALDHRLGARLAIALQQVVFERAGIDDVAIRGDTDLSCQRDGRNTYFCENPAKTSNGGAGREEK